MAANDPLGSILMRSRCLYDQQHIDQTITTMAEKINAELAHQNVLILCVMKGAVPFAAALMQRLSMSLLLDYIHVSRYGNDLSGGDIHWHAFPRTEIKDRTVLVVDDIYDEGITLRAIVDYCQQQQAAVVKTAVLVDKQHQRKVENLSVDYVGLSVPDEYVFGFGMDCEGWGRNLPAIYALSPGNST